MTRRRPRVVMLAVMLQAGLLQADGRELVDGRFPGGKSTVIRLSVAQAERLDFLHACRRDNAQTPYLFRLNARQIELLEQRSGVAVTRFAVIDSLRGDRVVDIPVNVLIRFAGRQAEIPHELLRSDAEARVYEVETIGWMPNPLEQVTRAQVRDGSCPP